MGVYLSKRADYVKLYLALWLVAFMGLWVNLFQRVQPARSGSPPSPISWCTWRS